MPTVITVLFTIGGGLLSRRGHQIGQEGRKFMLTVRPDLVSVWKKGHLYPPPLMRGRIQPGIDE
jgi:hypothetical protein